MTKSDALIAINAHFSNNYSVTEIAWPNIDFDTENVDEYVKIDTIFADSDQKTMGSAANSYRQFGTLSIQIFTALGEGPLRATNLSDTISGIWRGLNLNGVIFRSPDSVVIGNDRSGFYKENVIVDFYFDQTY